MADTDEASRPEFAEGVAIGALPDGGMVLGRVGDEAVLLARAGDELFAVGAHCTHYHGPLADGLVVGDTCGAPGTTPASACAAATRCVLRHWIRSPAGAWSVRAGHRDSTATALGTLSRNQEVWSGEIQGTFR